MGDDDDSGHANHFTRLKHAAIGKIVVTAFPVRLFLH